MRPVRWIAIPILLFLASCNQESSMKTLDPYIFLHDASSKIWLVDKLLINKNDYTPFRFEYKQVIAFHESRNAYFSRLKDFGKRPGLKTIYWMDREKGEFGFQFDKKEWLFSIVQLSRTKIVLKPKKNSYPYTIVLIPFPEY